MIVYAALLKKGPMLILSWNVHFQSLSGQLDNVVEAIRSARPDVVTLQEVKTSLSDDMALRLADIGACPRPLEWQEGPTHGNAEITTYPQVEAENLPVPDCESLANES